MIGQWVWDDWILNNMHSGSHVCGMVVVPPDFLGKPERIFLLSQRDKSFHNLVYGSSKRAQTGTLDVGYFDPADSSYQKLLTFRLCKHYLRSDSYRPDTDHDGWLWDRPSLHYNPAYRKVFIAGDDSRCVEGYDVVHNKWLFLPQTQFVHLKGCSVWSLPGQSHQILFVDQGKKRWGIDQFEEGQGDNVIEQLDLRSSEQRWTVSEQYMKWREIHDTHSQKVVRISELFFPSSVTGYRPCA